MEKQSELQATDVVHGQFIQGQLRAPIVKIIFAKKVNIMFLMNCSGMSHLGTVDSHLGHQLGAAVSHLSHLGVAELHLSQLGSAVSHLSQLGAGSLT